MANTAPSSATHCLAPTTHAIPILPFATPHPPPAPLIVLLDLTDLPVFDGHPALLFEEELGAPNIGEAKHTVRYHPYSRSRSSESARSRSPPSSISVIHTHNTRSLLRRASTSPLTSAPSSARSSPERSDVTKRNIPVRKSKIERPKDAARKNLEALLNWESAVYKEFKTAIANACKKHLDATACFKDQDTVKIKFVRSDVSVIFPVVNDYESSWPLDIAIQAYLKSSAALSKKKNMAATAPPS